MKYIIANWKMNMDLMAVRSWLDKFLSLVKDKPRKNKIIIAASNMHLPIVREALVSNKQQGIYTAAQDVSVYEKGAYTGETGAFQLKDFCEYSIIGHSERKEDRILVNQKIEQCLKENITPITCFVDINELTQSLKSRCLYAWEDPKNISKMGVYQNTDTDQISETFVKIKQLAPETTFIYGGSVNRNNIKAISQISGVEGVLPGNASLDPDHFVDIIAEFEQWTM